MVRDTLGQVLIDEGYVVDVAVDGTDALAHVHAACPDAILLDLMMPGMNGRQFLQALRDAPEYAQVPVLIMTAVHGLEINLASIGASEVVEKPFNVDELLNKVALAVYRSRDADLAHPPFTTAPAEATAESSDHRIVLLVEENRARLHAVDVLLSDRGYTVVSMTRAVAQLTQLARALRPRAILLEAGSEGVDAIVTELRASQELLAIPLLVYERSGEPQPCPYTFINARDDDLVAFVERAR
ncbi:MAG TPA: response regulator [Kofleriaceae bacterium]|nr:response regulator [Kofleriaceae bacterium]